MTLQPKPIAFAESALCDLEGIQDWYAEQLVAFPESGRIVPEFDMPALRELMHPPYRVVYHIAPDAIHVVRVWRSERLLKLP